MQAHIYINEVAPDTAVMDFSPGVTQLKSKDAGYGFAFLKTLEHLDLSYEEAEQEQGPSLLQVSGSVEQAVASLPDLQRHIGLIARYSAEKTGQRFDREWIGRTLGKLTQKEIPALSDSTPFRHLVGTLVTPFSQAIKDDGTCVHMDCVSSWRMTPEQRNRYVANFVCLPGAAQGLRLNSAGA
jgi:hypothetical protein